MTADQGTQTEGDADPTLSTNPMKSTFQPTDEAGALQRIIAELSPFESPARRRLVDTVCMFFDMNPPSAFQKTLPQPSTKSMLSDALRDAERFRFSEQGTPTIKQFLLDKSPGTDVERVTCLAFFLAHFLATPHFKTKDITGLNTEAAQRPFSNTAVAVDNATRSGYLVPSVKGCKQISAAGEQFVKALPDHVAAREVMDRMKARRGSGKRLGGKTDRA